jgi:hypothetical protein
MNNWRSRILDEITLQVSRLFLVADPDRLLMEEGILQEIRARGFDVVSFQDSVEFRYVYESKYRARWDLCEGADLALVVRSDSGDFNVLPWDLVQSGRRLMFSLGDLLPNLSYPVVAGLDQSYLDDLYKAYLEQSPENLGDKGTKDFILRYVFQTVPELICEPSHLLRLLLRRHYQGIRIPPVLDEHLIEVLLSRGLFDDWPLADIIPNKQMFVSFLQERWPVFLDQLVSPNQKRVNEIVLFSSFGWEGPMHLPFDHDDVRMYIERLFLDGLLQPVWFDKSVLLSREWVAVGIKTDPGTERLSHLHLG